MPQTDQMYVILSVEVLIVNIRPNVPCIIGQRSDGKYLEHLHCHKQTKCTLE